jgi:hypothetical protein
MYDPDMEHEEIPLVWAETSSQESKSFYEAAFFATVRSVKKKNAEDQTDFAVQQIYQSVANLIGIYGVEEDKEKVTIKYFSPSDGYGVWTFDIRFSVRGESNQVLAAAMTLPDATDRVNKELKAFVRGMEIERS